MLSVSNISVSFGKRKLLENVSFVINKSDRIGLVGPNGSGKSTLLKIIADIRKPDTGNVSYSPFTTTGYLPQDGIFSSDRTLIDDVCSSAKTINEISKETEWITQELQRHEPSSKIHRELTEKLGDLNHRYELLGGFQVKSKSEEILEGLGFRESDFIRKTSEFSGGWLMRIALAKLLLNEPSVLLLDEPTNHLDIESLIWLEDFLTNYRGAVMMVSHDIKSLDNLTHRTLEILNGKLTQYSGNYSFYETEKEKQKINLINTYRNQQKYLSQQKRFIERFRYKASKASNVQSRIKMIEKIKPPEIDFHEEEQINFSFPQATRSARKVIELINMSKNYGEKTVFENINLEIERGDRIGLLGKNGEGKSTLASVIAGWVAPTSGLRISGENISIGFYSQNVADTLDPENTVLGTLDAVAEGEVRKNLRNILGAFLFRGDDVFKKVSVLSGGEKSRLALAKMLLTPSNFLILDEPTNHLDVNSKKILTDALKKYQGTILLISHDRDFLDSVVTKVIEVKNKKIKIYPGNCSYYLLKKTEENITDILSTDSTKKANHTKDLKLIKRIEAERRNNLYRATIEVKNKIEELEKKISSKESELKNIEKLMSQPDFYKNSENLRKTYVQYSLLKDELNILYHNWNLESEKLEEIISNHNN
ncbi:MAG: ABC-F family ATP-binding cassette domain-containing protein [Ignavibacteria bacterium]|nr:ABC-F family ATP-binding cassette domain-containing protein [Ignavibacteria bacterium]